MISEKLKYYRKRKGWTQDDLAEKSGYSRSSIINWETGKRAPRTVDIEKLAIVLGVTPQKLLDDAPDTLNEQFFPNSLRQSKLDDEPPEGFSYWGGVFHTAMQLADSKNLQQIKMVASLLKTTYETLLQVIEQLQSESKEEIITVSAYNGENSSYTGNTLNLGKAIA